VHNQKKSLVENKNKSLFNNNQKLMNLTQAIKVEKEEKER
jgi:hypothetical protein